MASTLQALRQKLSEQIGDYWVSTATGGDADKLDIIDTALSGFQNTWLSNGADGRKNSTVLVIESTVGAESAKEERWVDSDLLTVATGIVGVTAVFTQVNAAGDDYEIHRKFTAADKERAIKWACYDAFPSLYVLIDDSSLRFGDWLRDGGFEIWTSATALTRWSTAGSGVAVAQTSTHYVRSGMYSCKITGGNGCYIYQAWHPTGSLTNNIDMQYLEGKSVTFRVWGYSATASALTISLEDGITTTYGNHSDHSSSTKVYHPGDSTWRLMEVTATIATNTTIVDVRIHNDSANAVYVDDASLTGIGDKMTYDISDLGLYNHQPNQIYAVSNRAANDTTPSPKDSIRLLDNWSTTTSSGLLTFKTRITDGTGLRIVGRGYLTQPADAGVNVITSWTSTEVTAPQDEIIVAGAALYLYKFIDLPEAVNNGNNLEGIQTSIAYWEQEYTKRKAQYGMARLAVTRLR